MNGILVDTDVLSYGLRSDARFDLFVPHFLGKVPFLSFMTYAELVHGMFKGNWGEKRRERLIDYVRRNYAIVYPTRQTCVNWALLTDSATRLGRVLSTADGWVAASARTLDIPIATNNARDFDYLPGIRLIKPDA